VVRTAEIFSVITPEEYGFRWAWRSSDGTQQSPAKFVYFYECVEDARRAGYSVELTGTRAKTVDGRDHHGLA
jgi:hypothetical protein